VKIEGEILSHEAGLQNVTQLEQSRWNLPVGRTFISVTAVAVVFLLAAIAIIIWLTRTESPQALASPTAPSPGWQVKAQLPTPRFGLAAAAYEDRIYAIAGETAKGVIGVNERYNPQSNAWETLAIKPLPVSDIGAVVIGGKIYVPGGRLATGETTDVFEVYDIRSNQWEQGPRLPVPLSAYALVAYEGKLYLFGGWDGQTYTDLVYAFDPSTNAWTEHTAMPTARGYAGAAVAGGKIYVIGGFDGKKAISVNEVYLPDRDLNGENPWEKASPMPDGRYAMGVSSAADILYVVGGKGGTTNSLRFLEYLPSEDGWLVFENSISEPISNLALVPLEAYLYWMGGQVEGSPISQNQAYKVIFTVAIPIVR
jgi:N-acetylneuraminic acid mutarotase